LSDSQIKQIAGRAGRYGLHGDDEPGGFVTTLRDHDLPALRKALEAPAKPSSIAYLYAPETRNSDVIDALPFGTTISVLLDTYNCVARMRAPFQFAMLTKADIICQFVDIHTGDLPLQDKLLLTSAPIPWNDPAVLNIIDLFLYQFRTLLRVNLVECLETGPLPRLEKVEKSIKHGLQRSSSHDLSALEALHKLLVVYMWMSRRAPVSWCDPQVSELKKRTERALDWCLQGLSWGSRSLPDLSAVRKRKEADQIPYLDRRILEHSHMAKSARRAAGMGRTGH
jgi:ATP-dependent RNA helicase SUPV3L1/SUV3